MKGPYIDAARTCLGTACGWDSTPGSTRCLEELEEQFLESFTSSSGAQTGKEKRKKKGGGGAGVNKNCFEKYILLS